MTFKCLYQFINVSSDQWNLIKSFHNEADTPLHNKTLDLFLDIPFKLQRWSVHTKMLLDIKVRFFKIGKYILDGENRLFLQSCL